MTGTARPRASDVIPFPGREPLSFGRVPVAADLASAVPLVELLSSFTG
jgi:hypothetical protein